MSITKKRTLINASHKPKIYTYKTGTESTKAILSGIEINGKFNSSKERTPSKADLNICLRVCNALKYSIVIYLIDVSFINSCHSQ